MTDRPADDVALFGIAGHRAAANITYLGLHALQHRGTSGAGLVASTGDALRVRRAVGRVRDQFGGPQLAGLRGGLALGAVFRLPGEELADAVVEPEAPIVLRSRYGQVAVAMTGALLNGAALRAELMGQGAAFGTSLDAEILARLVVRSEKRTFVNRLVDALWMAEGGFAAVFATEDALVAVRGPHGVRPLHLARVDGAPAVSTSSSALELVGGVSLRELAPGELVILDPRGAQSVRPFSRRPRVACAMEPVALAAAGDRAFGQAAYAVREGLGAALAAACPPGDADVVVGVPDHGLAVGLGYARAAGLPLQLGLVRAPHHEGAPLVEPAHGLPDFGTRLNFEVVGSAVAGRSVALVAPTLVTGTELRRLVRLVRGAGARAVHVRIATPAVVAGCAFGVSLAPEQELLGASERDLAVALGAETAACLPVDALRAALGPQGWCDQCVSGQPPMEGAEPGQLDLF